MEFFGQIIFIAALIIILVLIYFQIRQIKKYDKIIKENEKLRKQIKRLEERLDKAETIIDIQKKISKLLGIKQPPLDTEEDD